MMQRIFWTALSFFAFASPAVAQQLTVATFNTEFLIRDRVHMREGFDLNLSTADQALWTPQRRETAFVNAVNRIAPVILSIGADVIVLTEVGPASDVATLNQRVGALGLSYPYVAVCECTDGNTRQHVAILSRIPFTRVMPSLEGRERFLAEPDDEETELDTGISKGMRVDFNFSGESISLYGVHLVSERGGYDTDAQRLAQASIIRRLYLQDLAQGRHVIVAGDMNDRRGDPAIQRLRGLDDIHPDLIQTGHLRYFADDQAGERWTYEFQGIRQQIDHILVSDSLQRGLVTNGIRARVQRVTDAETSDHSPLVVTLNFRD